jgi:hypothetical protein
MRYECVTSALTDATALQYFSSESLIAISTSRGSIPVPLTIYSISIAV